MQPLIARLPFFLFISFVLAGCAASVQSKLSYNPLEPIRVVVLPFIQINANGERIDPNPNLLIDKVSLISSKLDQPPPQLVKGMVEAEIPNTAIDLVPAVAVEDDLIHHGFTKDDGTLDLNQLFKTSATEICRHLAACDAVLYGTVTKWERNYYGLQSVSTVGIKLSLVTKDDGKTIFESAVEDSDSRGLTKGPTGFSNLVIEPVRGLDNEIIAALAKRVVQKAMAPLFVKNQPGYLKTPAPAIFAVGHDHPSGTLAPGERLVVLLLGSEKKEASFSIGAFAVDIPMYEVEPSQYVGEYFPLETDHFTNEPVVVTLQDSFGRKVKQLASAMAISR